MLSSSFLKIIPKISSVMGAIISMSDFTFSIFDISVYCFSLIRIALLINIWLLFSNYRCLKFLLRPLELYLFVSILLGKSMSLLIMMNMWNLLWTTSVSILIGNLVIWLVFNRLVSPSIHIFLLVYWTLRILIVIIC